MRTSILGKVHVVASTYDPETRAKAVRLVLEHCDDYASEWAAMTAPVFHAPSGFCEPAGRPGPRLVR